VLDRETAARQIARHLCAGSECEEPFGGAGIEAPLCHKGADHAGTVFVIEGGAEIAFGIETGQERMPLDPVTPLLIGVSLRLRQMGESCEHGRIMRPVGQEAVNVAFTQN